MRCFGQNLNNNLCDMCKRIDAKYFNDCVTTNISEISLCRRLREIAENCKFRMNCWDEYTPFYGCHKDGNGYGRSAKSCSATLECELNKK